MLIIPMTGKLSWRNPPVITIFLILINCFVYFGIQSGDDERYEAAAKYYVSSDLAGIEIGKFVEYMKEAKRGEEVSLPEGKKLNDPVAVAHLRYKMMEDSDFMAKLNGDQIIAVSDPVYPRWKELKSKHEKMLSEVISEVYGYRPAGGSLTTAFTYMFLHGSASHLIGNMVFLWLVGCTLELAGRRSAYGLTNSAKASPSAADTTTKSPICLNACPKSSQMTSWERLGGRRLP